MFLKKSFFLIILYAEAFVQGQTCTNIGSGLGDNTNTAVHDITVFQNTIYGCGLFENTPLISGVNSIAKLNSGEWESLSGQITNMGSFPEITDMELMGDSLVICGAFDTVDGVFTESVLFFDGTQFLPFVSNSQNIIVPWVAWGVRYFGDTLFCYGSFKVGPGLSVVPNRVGYLNDNNEWVLIGSALPSPIRDVIKFNNTLYAATNVGLYFYDGSSWQETITPLGGVFDLAVYHDTLFTLGDCQSTTDEPFYYTTDNVVFHSEYHPFISAGTIYTENNLLLCITTQTDDNKFHAYKWNGFSFYEKFELTLNNSSPQPLAINEYFELNDTAYLCGNWTINSTYSVAMCDYFSIAEVKPEVQVELVLFPIPIDGHLNVKLDNSVLGKSYTITNQIGQILQSGIIQSEFMVFSMDEYESGMYYFNITGVISKQIPKVN